MLFKENGYDCVKLFVTQVAISLFGFARATACARLPILVLLTSFLAIAFYLVMIYTTTWNIGYKNHNKVEHGEKDIPLRGLWISMIANIPNFIVATLFTIGFPWKETATWAGNMCAVAKTITIITHGEYCGVLAEIKVGELPIRDFWWAYFLIIIPALVVTAVAYQMGLKDIKIIKAKKKQ